MISRNMPQQLHHRGHGSLYSSIHGRLLTSTTAFLSKLCESLQKRSGLASSRFTSQAIQPSCYLLCLSIISPGFESCSSSLSFLRSSKASTSEISAMFSVRSSSLSMPDIAAGLLSSYISVTHSSKSTSRVTGFLIQPRITLNGQQTHRATPKISKSQNLSTPSTALWRGALQLQPGIFSTSTTGPALEHVSCTPWVNGSLDISGAPTLSKKRTGTKQWTQSASARASKLVSWSRISTMSGEQSHNKSSPMSSLSRTFLR